jgi:hypothetical protein
MKTEVTFAFKGDKAFAIREGKVIATSHVDNIGDLEKVAFGDPMGGQPPMGDPHAIDAPTEMPPPPPGIGEGEQGVCHGCGYQLTPGEEVCPQCGEPLADPGMADMGDPLDGGGMPYGDPGDDFPDHGPRQASITTPNGLKGKVLGKVAGLWQDEVTVRLENGRIVHLPVSKDMTFERTASAPKPTNPVEQFEQRLAASVDGTRDSLVLRNENLEKIAAEARELLTEGVSDDVAEKLDGIVVSAYNEMVEIDHAIAHLDDEHTSAYAPPAPFSMQAAASGEVAVSLGGKDGSWLDKTANEMIAEAESTDFKRLMDEGPEALTAELETPALADAGVVRQMAASFIRTKTAGTDPQVRDPYEDLHQACRRVPPCRAFLAQAVNPEGGGSRGGCVQGRTRRLDLHVNATA